MTGRKSLCAVGAACLAVTLLTGYAEAPGDDALVGSWGSTAIGKPSLLISGDGSFSGSDGCNRLSGTGKIDGSAITFGHFAITAIGCPGMDVWLGQAATGKVSGKTLVVFDDSGNEVGSLTKSAGAATPERLRR